MSKIQNKKVKFILKISIFFTICFVLLFSLFFAKNIEAVINNTQFFNTQEFKNANFKISFIDVGQGDCTFIQVDNKSIMIDCATNENADKIIRYLRNIGYNRFATIDYLILTHPDSDHIGGASKILQEYNVKNIFIPEVYSSFEVEQNFNTNNFWVDYSPIWEQTMRAVYQEVGQNNLFYNFAGQKIEGEDYSIDFYYPTSHKIGEEYSSNSYSPIIMFSSFGFKTLFTGDIDSNIENTFITENQTLVEDGFFNCDVLKVAHHGSRGSTSQNFLNATNPEIAVISCSKDNSYFHPTNEVINRLDGVGCTILRTDTTGSSVVYLNQNTLKIKTNFCFVGSFYFEWMPFVFGAIFCLSFVFAFKIKG